MENVKENYGRNESEILGSYMNSCEGDAQARGMADAVARRSYGKLVAFLAARAGDVAAAEDALSDAFVSALTDWPQNGCPSNPEAWLLTVARRKMIDLARRRRYSEVATERLNLLAEGLDAKIIASAFLTSPAAMGKRLVRAKSKIRQAGIPFSVPEREELPGRLDAVLDAIHAAFSEGWTDPGGTDIVRRGLTEEALFLSRLVADLLPEEPEALGLLALMLHAEA